MKILIKQLSRFTCVGVVATALHVSVAVLCVSRLAFEPLVANMLGFLVAAVWSFTGNWAWTFEKAVGASESGKRYAVLTASCFAISQLIVFVTVVQLEMPMWLAMIPIVLLVPGLSFVGSKLHVFR